MNSGRLPPTCRSALIPSNSTGLKKDMYDTVAEFMRISADVDRRANEEENKQIRLSESLRQEAGICISLQCLQIG